jgi:uncharacterized protein YyaL (SSP411 family)
MLKSLKLYSTYFLKSAFSPAGKYVVCDLNRFMLKNNVFRQDFNFSQEDKKEALGNGINWLITSQKSINDGGMGSFHLINKWSSSYPETTGYIIPTLINFYRKNNNPEVLEPALKAADFLLNIQKPSGGWQGGRVHENKPEIVFNTAQVMRGMMAAYAATGNKKYLDSAVQAGNWLAEIQHPEGFWKEHALMNAARVYDTFVDAPLLELFRITGEENLKTAAIRNLDWVVDRKMKDNGWFEDCDNTVKRNDRPILHTIAYTLDGLIDSGLIINQDKYIEDAKKGADELRKSFLSKGFLPGRYDRNWNGSEHMICTGCAQMAIVWLKFFRITGDKIYIEAATKMINLLIFIQSRKIKDESMDTLGAIPGSFPLWGRYEPFVFPNWATKFFCDALLLEEEIVK